MPRIHVYQVLTLSIWIKATYRFGMPTFMNIILTYIVAIQQQQNGHRLGVEVVVVGENVELDTTV